MSKANQDIRSIAKANNIFLWQICDFLGVSEPTMTRWLRKPLSADKEQQILQAIEVLKGGAENEYTTLCGIFFSTATLSAGGYYYEHRAV